MSKKKKGLSGSGSVILILLGITVVLLVVMDYLKYRMGLDSFIFHASVQTGPASVDAGGGTDGVVPGKVTAVKTGGSIYRDREVPPPPLEKAGPEPDTSVTPEIALIIDDVGYDPETLEKAVELDFPITFAVLPYTPYALQCARKIHENGKEVILHLPMEPLNYPETNPGKGAVLTTMSKGEIIATVTDNILSIPYVAGINNHMGSRATADPGTMKLTLETIDNYGLYFVDSRTTAETVAYTIAREMNIPSAEKTLFIDNEESRTYIISRLEELYQEALKRGKAIGIGHIYPATVEAMAEYLPLLRKKGAKIVFASDIVD